MAGEVELVRQMFDDLIKSRFIEMFGDIKSNSKGWKSNKLGELGTFKTGGTPSSKHEEFYNGSIPFISTPSLGPNYIDETAAKYLITEEAVNSCATALIPAGSLIIGTRINVGQSSINTVPLCTNQDIVSMMNVKEEYNLLFLKHCIDQYLTYLDSQKKGATIKGITTDLLKSIRIPEPPIEQQNQYEVFVKQVDKSKFILEQEVARYDQLVKSRFIEIFGDPVSSKKYDRIPFSELILNITNGMGSPPSFESEGHAFIRATNISNGSISDTDMLYISDDTASKLSRYQVHEGDFIFVRSGAYAGDVAVIPKQYDGEYGAYDINVCIDKERVNPIYLNSMFNSTYLERIIRPLTTRSAQPHLNTKQVSNLSILVPPIDLQDEFAAFVEQVDKSKLELIQTVQQICKNKTT